MVSTQFSLREKKLASVSWRGVCTQTHTQTQQIHTQTLTNTEPKSVHVLDGKVHLKTTTTKKNKENTSKVLRGLFAQTLRKHAKRKTTAEKRESHAKRYRNQTKINKHTAQQERNKNKRNTLANRQTEKQTANRTSTNKMKQQ